MIRSRMAALSLAVLTAIVVVVVVVVVVEGGSMTGGRSAASMPARYPGGRINLHAYGLDGRLLTWAQFRRLQVGAGASALDGVDDALVDPVTLRVLRTAPLYGSGTLLSLDRPAGAVSLSLAWPSSTGYSTLILDLPAPGTYVFNQLAARQAVDDLTGALKARPDYVPGPAFAAEWRAARADLAAATTATAEGARAAQAQNAYDHAVRAQLQMLAEYGVRYASLTARLPAMGFTIEDPDDAGAALRAVQRIVSGSRVGAAVRFVFDLAAPPEQYVSAVEAAHRAGISVIGQFLDSSQMAQTSLAGWQSRVMRYVAVLAQVDTWEVGNEVNGAWLGGQVEEKVAFAAAWVKAHSRARTLVTLYWQLGEDDAAHSMFTWVARSLPASTRASIDEIGMSVYPENAPLGFAFDRVFRTLHAAFPHQQLSIAELGYGSADLDHRWWWGSPTDWTGAGRQAVADLYGRAVLGYPFSAGGTYWWYFQTEAPYGSPLWRTFAQLAAALGR